MIVKFRPQPEALDRLRSGLLAPHLESFAALLAQQGYCAATGWMKIQLVGDLSQWLTQQHTRLKSLAEPQITAFLTQRWQRATSLASVVLSKELRLLRIS